jgi:DMSO/TMAO reductase YedYZ molybdopterin-dependent catalytic subunit
MLFFISMLGKFFHKPQPAEQERVPPGQYLANNFPIMTYGQTPDVTRKEWKLKIWGLVPQPLTFTWEDVMKLPQQEFTADFHCVTRWSKLDVTWQGFKIVDLMKLVGDLDPSAVHVMEHCYGGYTTNLPLEDFLREENFFAYELNGEPLPKEHGGPMRTMVPHLYAWKSAKWISGIEFIDREQSGFWEQNGYHKRGEPWTEERYS